MLLILYPAFIYATNLIKSLLCLYLFPKFEQENTLIVVCLSCIGYGLAVLGISKDEGNLEVQLGVVGCLQVVPVGLKVVKLFASTICWSMLLNSAVSTTITAQNSKIKKTSSSRVVPSHIGDSAGTTVIMGLDLNNATSKRMLWQCQL